jgi:hypothetical protein
MAPLYQPFREFLVAPDNRRPTDAERFVVVLGQTMGRRITYAELTGKLDTPIVPA